MFKFTKKLVLAVSFLGVYSCQFEAFGSKPILDEACNSKQQLVLLDTAAFVPQRQVFDVKEKHGVFQDGLPKDLMKSFLVEAFKRGADPSDVERVCRSWYNLLRYKIPGSGAPKADLAGIAYETKLNDIFMEDCMKLYMEGVVSRAVLYYKKGDAEKERVIRFSDFQNGAANLVDCEGEDRYLVYTNSLERLSIVRGENEDKLVTFIGTFQEARRLLPANAKGTVADVVFMWKWGNDMLNDERGMPYFDYLIIRPSGADGVNMFQNWTKSVLRVPGSASAIMCGLGGRRAAGHVVMFVL